MPQDKGYKMPHPMRGSAASKAPSSLTGLPSEGIGGNNMGSASGMSPSSLSGEPAGAKSTGTAFQDNRGPQPAGKVSS